MNLKPWIRSVTVASSLLTAGVGFACSLALTDAPRPSPGATGVPTNVKPSVLMSAQAPVKLVRIDAAGTEVETISSTSAEEEAGGGMKRVVLSPGAALEPNSRYRVVAEFASQGKETIADFTTGADADNAAPPRPQVTVRRIVPYVSSSQPVSGSACLVDTGLRALEVKSEGASTFLVKEGGAVVAAGPGSNLNYPFICPGEKRSVTVSVTALDLAGNASDPGESTFDVECIGSQGNNQLPTSGCGATAGGAGWLAVLALGLLRRRARFLRN